MVRTHIKNNSARNMSQNMQNQEARRKAYPRRYVDDKATQSLRILAVSHRVAEKIKHDFVTSPQSILKIHYRRQALPCLIFSGNASNNYFLYESY